MTNHTHDTSHILPVVKVRMSYHDVSIDGDGEDVEDGDSQQSIP